MDARSRGRETDLRRRAVAWEPSADQSDGGAASYPLTFGLTADLGQTAASRTPLHS